MRKNGIHDRGDTSRRVTRRPAVVFGTQIASRAIAQMSIPTHRRAP